MLISATGLSSSCIFFQPRITQIKSVKSVATFTFNTSSLEYPARLQESVAAPSPVRFRESAAVLFRVRFPDAGVSQVRFPELVAALWQARLQESDDTDQVRPLESDEPRPLSQAQLPALPRAQSPAVFLL